VARSTISASQCGDRKAMFQMMACSPNSSGLSFRNESALGLGEPSKRANAPDGLGLPQKWKRESWLP
jgi:hypothetical protein